MARAVQVVTASAASVGDALLGVPLLCASGASEGQHQGIATFTYVDIDMNLLMIEACACVAIPTLAGAVNGTKHSSIPPCNLLWIFMPGHFNLEGHQICTLTMHLISSVRG